MSNVRSFCSNEQRLKEAGDWIARLDRGLTSDEQESLERWLSVDTKNREVLGRVLKVWNKAESLSRLSSLFPKPASRSERYRPLLWSTAATLATVTIVSVAWVLAYRPAAPASIPGPPQTANDNRRIIETAVGERQVVTLADGSVINLNTNTLIEASYSAQRRHLVLHRGEASFDVAHDGDRRFSVHAQGNTVTALGTVFHLELSRNNGLELVVTDGKVMVDVPATTGSPATLPAPAARQPILVSAGEELTFGTDNPVVRAIDPVDVKVRLSWHEGRVVFRGETMEQVEREIRRYSDVEFVYLDDGIRQEPVGGMYLEGELNEFLENLEANFNIQYQRIGERRVLLSRE